MEKREKRRFEREALPRWMESYAQSKGEKLLEEYDRTRGSAQPLPETLDQKNRALVEKHLENGKKRTPVRHLRLRLATAASIVLVFLAALFVLSQPAVASRLEHVVRDSFANYSVTEDADAYYLHFRCRGTAGPHDPDALREILKKYTPEDYTLEEERIWIGDAFAPYEQNNFMFENEKGKYLWLSIEAPTGRFRFEKEGTVLKEYSLVGYDAILVQRSNGVRHLMWVDEEEMLMYHLCALDMEEAVFLELAYQLALP